MRAFRSAVAWVGLLCYAASMVGCDSGPQPGTQIKVSDEENQKRAQGIKDAMKAGMYNNPISKKAPKAQ
jgi:hypothetical protein